MNQRVVLEHRIVTLNGLLDSPGGPLGPNAGPLGDRLRDDWQTERRLLLRLLDESAKGDLRATIEQWRTRTQAFAARASEGSATWVDKEGHEWMADKVLQLLDETDERIDRWQRLSDQPDGQGSPPMTDAASPSTAQER